MPSRHEKQIYEGQSRRLEERRKSDRRKSVNIIKFLSYLAVAIAAVAVVKFLKL
ncbi:MAG TPA: hypothetical protein VGC12_02535 [Methyloradius sp.]